MAQQFRYVKKTFKIGNSLAVTIPSIWCKANNLKEKDKLILEVSADKIVIKCQK